MFPIRAFGVRIYNWVPQLYLIVLAWKRLTSSNCCCASIDEEQIVPEFVGVWHNMIYRHSDMSYEWDHIWANQSLYVDVTLWPSLVSLTSMMSSHTACREGWQVEYTTLEHLAQHIVWCYWIGHVSSMWDNSKINIRILRMCSDQIYS